MEGREPEDRGLKGNGRKPEKPSKDLRLCASFPKPCLRLQRSSAKFLRGPLEEEPGGGALRGREPED